LGQGVDGSAQAQIHSIGESGAGDVGAGDVGVLRVELQGDEAAAGRERPREPNGAVAAKGSHFQDGARMLQPRQHVKQFPLRCRYLNLGEPCGRARREGSLERRVVGREEVGEVVVDVSVGGGGHGSSMA